PRDALRAEALRPPGADRVDGAPRVRGLRRRLHPGAPRVPGQPDDGAAERLAATHMEASWTISQAGPLPLRGRGRKTSSVKPEASGLPVYVSFHRASNDTL